MGRFRRAAYRALVLAAALAAAGSAGCKSGPAVGEVSGKITFKGKPVTEGTVTFFNPTTGYAADAPLEKDGSYAVKTRDGGLVVGEYVVTVTPPMVMDNSDPRTPPSPMEKRVANIPGKYRAQGTSPLRAKVEEGKNNFEFDMKP